VAVAAEIMVFIFLDTLFFEFKYQSLDRLSSWLHAAQKGSTTLPGAFLRAIKRTTFTHARHKQLKSKCPFAKFKDIQAFIPVSPLPSPIAGNSGMLGE
tara:strand:- start:1087 stop:1380 length:294 start_codon:yes stop_codon:yes gene_type:complete